MICTGPIENKKGAITIFPSYVFHKSEVYTNADGPRLTIAFDLHIPEENDGVKKIPFMNKSIFNQIVKENHNP